MTQEKPQQRSQARRRVRSAPQVRPVVNLPNEFRLELEKIASQAVDSIMSAFPEDRLPTTGSEFKKLEESLQAAVGIHIVGAVLALVFKILHLGLDRPFAARLMRQAQQC